MKKLPEVFIGERFGRLVAIEDWSRRGPDRVVKCRCDCGAITEPRINELRKQRGMTLSCGCLGRERRLASNIKHGQSRHPLFKVWDGMLQRCGNPNRDVFRHYGGRGITVCEEWREFSPFLAWATSPLSGPAWEPGLTLERVDNDAGYGPANCIWATRKQQTLNRRGMKLYEFEGRQLTQRDLALRLGVAHSTLQYRIKNMPFEKAVSIGASR